MHEKEMKLHHAVSDAALDAVSGGAGGTYDYTITCRSCGEELKPGRLVYLYEGQYLCDTCFREIRRSKVQKST